MTTTKGPKQGTETILDKSFGNLKDFRRTSKGNIRYSLQEIIFLTISAVISGCQTYEFIEAFGKNELEWLRKFYPYKNGTPSHDTLGEFYSRIDRKSFSACLFDFLKSLKKLDSRLIAFDGKTVRGMTCEDGYPLHILTAFCNKNRMSLGEEIVAGKENEIVAIPRLLELIEVKGCVITIDAMGCQTDIAEKIIERKADYILQVKNNQKQLCRDIEDSFRLLPIHEKYISEDVGHGRVEIRKCSVMDNLELISGNTKWKSLKTIVRIESEIYEKKSKKTVNNTRYYISSLAPNAKELGEDIRGHWSIESFHWSLDVIFKEDNQAKRNENAVANFNTISKCAISLLIDEKDYKKSKPLKRFKAMMDRKYREKILNI